MNIVKCLSENKVLAINLKKNISSLIVKVKVKILLFDEKENFQQLLCPSLFPLCTMVSKSRDIDYFNSMVNKGKLQTFKPYNLYLS